MLEVLGPLTTENIEIKMLELVVKWDAVEVFTRKVIEAKERIKNDNEEKEKLDV